MRVPHPASPIGSLAAHAGTPRQPTRRRPEPCVPTRGYPLRSPLMVGSRMTTEPPPERDPYPIVVEHKPETALNEVPASQPVSFRTLLDLVLSSQDYESALAAVARLSLPEFGAWSIVDVIERPDSMRRLGDHPSGSGRAGAGAGTPELLASRNGGSDRGARRDAHARGPRGRGSEGRDAREGGGATRRTWQRCASWASGPMWCGRSSSATRSSAP